MLIGGIQKLTLLDYPGKVAATIFTVGCNFRCPFCHNAPLVNKVEKNCFIDEEEILSFLNKRVGIIDGVVITGGEPTLMTDLPEFISKIKALGYNVKLDTNGTNPEMLEYLINNKMIDYVAMDIKNCIEKYTETAGVDDSFDLGVVKRSAEILMQNAVDFEFRTTVVSPYHTEEDFERIGQWLAGEEKFYLQAFVDSGNLVGDGVHGVAKEKMVSFCNVLKQYVENAQIRGI